MQVVVAVGLCQLLGDDVQPVQVDGVGVADHHRERRRQVDDVVGRRSVDRLAGPNAIPVICELGRQAALNHLFQPVGVVVLVSPDAVRG